MKATSTSFRGVLYFAELIFLDILCSYFSCRHGAMAAGYMPPPAFSSPIGHVVTSRYFSHRSRRDNMCPPLVVFEATPDGNEKAVNTLRSARDRGIYTRPSAAIEQGSGFFIPGLEGSRIRFIFGITVLIADAANHVLVGGRPGDWGQTVAESVTAFYGALLLLQGSIEWGVEMGYAGGGEDIIGLENEDGPMSNKDGGSGRRVAYALQGKEETARMIQRMAETIITFTPATYLQLLDEELGVLFSLGVSNDAPALVDVNEQKRLAKILMDALSESRGGRVALPSEHPASELLPEAATRCILVQKVNGCDASSVWLIGSDSILPAFTKNDLRWIGQLADYINLLGNKY